MVSIPANVNRANLGPTFAREGVRQVLAGGERIQARAKGLCHLSSTINNVETSATGTPLVRASKVP